MRWARSAVLGVVVLVACGMAEVPLRDSIVPPPALSMKDVEDGILRALAPPSLWAVDGAEPGAVYAARVEGEQALLVAIDYSTYSVSLRIVAAQGLEYTGPRMGRQGVEWMDQLDEQVRVALGARHDGPLHRW
jgi:hypothetical protein